MCNKRPDRIDGLQGQDLGEELMLYDPCKDKLHILNGTSRVVWKMSDGSHTLSEIEEEIRKRFSFSGNSDVTEDIKKVIKDMEGKGLLKERYKSNVKV